MSKNDPVWQLDSRLQNDTITVFENGGLTILLMNDQRWPWLIVVPKIVGAEELHDMDPQIRQAVMDIAVSTGEKLKSFANCDKINIAAIGNMVRQLHIHVIARSEGDANWPGPVWGHGQAEKYDQTQVDELVGKLKENLFDTPLS
ncbi:MAG: HIT domain-containing protein [Rhizobiaceae bacterium]|nr:HIT domain-containing protein [Rhizobiaceae bacterium]